MVYRRSCFKCGNAGHIAEVCPELERLCYNCKQPGHESNNCPRPRTIESKQCYICGGRKLGHIQTDCPSARTNIHHSREQRGTAQGWNNKNTDDGGSGPARCYNCGRVGHFARTCHNRPQAALAEVEIPLGHRQAAGVRPRRGGRHGGLLTRSCVVCYNCGGPNHFARDCQAVSKSIKCYQCGKFGHIARDCTTSSNEAQHQDKVCYRCNEVGHIARDCTSSVGENRYRDKVCYRCNELGHIARDCTASPLEDDSDDEEDEEEQVASSQRSASPAALAAQQTPTKRRTDESEAESDVEST